MNNNIYRDYSAMRAEFREGIACLADNNNEGALDAFACADVRTPRDDVYKPKYQSFHGLLLVRAGQLSGIDMCRAAASAECFDGDVFYNLARAELERSNRRAAIQAIIKGLEADSSHPDLQSLRQRLGIRRCCTFAFLGRDHFINKLIGKFTYGNPVRCF